MDGRSVNWANWIAWLCPGRANSFGVRRGLPAAGEIFPTTHAIRVVRGLLLKGNALPDVWPELWPIALFTLAAVLIAIWFYRETLD
jgi:ABC-2 type transport system permease protein